MKRTVKEVRAQLKRSAYSAWSLTKRKVVYGFTEAQVRRNLVRVSFCGRGVWVHKRMAPSLSRAGAAIREYERKHPDTTKKWVPDRVDGFAWRTIRGGKSLSRHAHGIAIDIEPATNPSYRRYNSTITTTIPLRVINALRAEGWQWGGEWDAPCDTMHFQRH